MVPRRAGKFHWASGDPRCVGRLPDNAAKTGAPGISHLTEPRKISAFAKLKFTECAQPGDRARLFFFARRFTHDDFRRRC
jgi:hypothetical protein